LKQEFRNTD